jgi:hypothetical protein
LFPQVSTIFFLVILVETMTADETAADQIRQKVSSTSISSMAHSPQQLLLPSFFVVRILSTQQLR